MRKFFYLFALTMLGYMAQAQNSDSIRIAQLQGQLDQVTQLLVERDSAEYEKVRNTLFDGAFRSTYVGGRVDELYGKVNDVKFIAQLLNVNNVDTRQLMEQFENMFRDAVSRKLDQLNVRDTARRNGIFRLIRGISSSPILGPVLHSNPITSFITSGVSLIAGIAQPELNVRTNMANLVKEVDMKMRQLFNWEEILEIQKKIEPYVQFYDTLSLMNSRFTARMINLQQEVEKLKDGLRPSLQVMRSRYGVTNATQPNEILVKLNQAFAPPTGTGLARYHQFLRREDVQGATAIALRINGANEAINGLAATYEALLAEFKKDYLGVIRRFKDRLPLMRTRLEEQYASLSAQLEQPIMNAMIPNNLSEAERRAIRLREGDHHIDRSTEEQVIKTIFQ